MQGSNHMGFDTKNDQRDELYQMRGRKVSKNVILRTIFHIFKYFSYFKTNRISILYSCPPFKNKQIQIQKPKRE